MDSSHEKRGFTAQIPPAPPRSKLYCVWWREQWNKINTVNLRIQKYNNTYLIDGGREKEVGE
jgi:hypothetical protein